MSDQEVTPIPQPSSPLHLDQLLEQRSIAAGVQALAARNAHHLGDMDEEEQANAHQSWGEMVTEILSAVRSTLGEIPVPDGPGRAVIILSDHPEEPGEVQAEAIFSPQVQEQEDENGDSQVIATFAQVMAMQLAELLPQVAEQMAQGGVEPADSDE